METIDRNVFNLPDPAITATLEKQIVKRVGSGVFEVDAADVYYRNLNQVVRNLVDGGAKKIVLRNVAGQRYIATNMEGQVEIEIHGTPGNDLGSFMNGSTITVFGNAQDGCGNTMNDGKIVVHGHAGDILGMSMRGGEIYIRDDVGYRVAIHMKEYMEKIPVLVIGGTSQDFFGEYMAGGIVILLGLTLGKGEKHRARFIGTGMHGGVIFLRGSVEEYQLGKEVGIREPDENDRAKLERYIKEYARLFDKNADEIFAGQFSKLLPVSKRPYGKLYAY
ncbi:MAG: hypothetical protein AB1546_05265 [bacterium]